jgi:hypothetical protein
MELRQNIRHAVDFPVKVRARGRILADCRARNISLDGMLIETGPDSLPRNALVEIELSLQVDASRERRRVLATVVHHDNGTGFMFIEELQLYPFQNLERLIASV